MRPFPDNFVLYTPAIEIIVSKQAIVSDEREELERDLNFTEPTYEDVLNVSGKNLNISTRKSRAYNLGYWGYFVSKRVVTVR